MTPVDALPDPDGLADGVVLLRPWTEADAPLLAEAARDEYVALIEGMPDPPDDSSVRAWIEAKRAYRAAGRGWELAVVDVARGEAVGGVGLGFRHPPGAAEPGAWVVGRERGRGIAGRAVGLLCGWALTADTGIDRVQAGVHPWNAAAQRVLERLGFVREGLLREYTAYRGVREDVVLYSLLRSDLSRRPA